MEDPATPPSRYFSPQLKHSPFSIRHVPFIHRLSGSSRGRLRQVLLTAAILLAFVYYWSATSGPRSEHDRLEYYMNGGSHSHRLPAVKQSSFDWSKVKFRYAPDTIQQLPVGKPLALRRVQYDFAPDPASAGSSQAARRQEVKDVFAKTWRSYREYAWKKDVLQPISATFKDQWAGWSATLVDSLDTLWLMEMRDEFDEAVAAVAEIDFGQASTARINSFETTIRYLGGLLAAYDLSKRQVLLQKATELGDLLYAGFNTPNHMPVDFIDFAAAKTGEGLSAEVSVVSASPGTLSMEMTHLAQLTGNPKYYDAASRVMDLFHRGQNKTLLPGMWPIYVSMRSQDVTSGNKFTLAGCADSLYEYLPKMYALLGGREAQKYELMTKLSLDAGDTLLFRPMLPNEDDVLIAGNVDMIGGQASLDPESEHLACFAGGMYALAGRLFDRPKYMDTASKLTRGCAYTYRSMPSGMGPERFNMVACPSRDKCKWDETVWTEETKKRPQWKSHLPKGFTTAKDPRYILRPEAIESVFVMYRATGDQEYQDIAWDMFQAISKGTFTSYANAAVVDVTLPPESLAREDYMESFWLAETLKYFYLVFSPPSLISLDEWVFNTEAHPFRRPK